mmetsp:Transcript_25725/g.75936  ORF Transcript_25725/g.75936 Transcript_25725/m.75936 type:complete len:460 (-) Transcript_25725:765-2144(-)
MPSMSSTPQPAGPPFSSAMLPMGGMPSSKLPPIPLRPPPLRAAILLLWNFSELAAAAAAAAAAREAKSHLAKSNNSSQGTRENPPELYQSPNTSKVTSTDRPSPSSPFKFSFPLPFSLVLDDAAAASFVPLLSTVAPSSSSPFFSPALRFQTNSARHWAANSAMPSISLLVLSDSTQSPFREDPDEAADAATLRGERASSDLRADLRDDDPSFDSSGSSAEGALLSVPLPLPPPPPPPPPFSSSWCMHVDIEVRKHRKRERTSALVTGGGAEASSSSSSPSSPSELPPAFGVFAHCSPGSSDSSTEADTDGRTSLGDGGDERHISDRPASIPLVDGVAAPRSVKPMSFMSSRSISMASSRLRGVALISMLSMSAGLPLPSARRATAAAGLPPSPLPSPFPPAAAEAFSFRLRFFLLPPPPAPIISNDAASFALLSTSRKRRRHASISLSGRPSERMRRR